MDSGFFSFIFVMDETGPFERDHAGAVRGFRRASPAEQLAVGRGEDSAKDFSAPASGRIFDSLDRRETVFEPGVHFGEGRFEPEAAPGDSA
jgi:hypothetical protein